MCITCVVSIATISMDSSIVGICIMHVVSMGKYVCGHSIRAVVSVFSTHFRVGLMSACVFVCLCRLQGLLYSFSWRKYLNKACFVSSPCRIPVVLCASLSLSLGDIVPRKRSLPAPLTCSGGKFVARETLFFYGVVWWPLNGSCLQRWSQRS